ncbi:hypothetical protein ACFX11_031120 [Malus domestica]
MNQETWLKSPFGRSKNKLPLLYSFTFSFCLNCFHVQPLLEVEFNVLLLNTSGMVGHSTATTGSFVLTTEPNALVRLQELLFLLVLQVLERQGLDSVGACLKDLAVDGQLSTKAINRVSSTLERT